MRNKSDHQLLVEEFMRLASQDFPSMPGLPAEPVLLFRAKLILEEALETIRGLGYVPVWRDGGSDSGELTPELRKSGNAPDIIEIVDGCADVSVVTIGTLSALEIADVEILEAVDNNNLEKFGPGGHRRADGKWVKPPGHKPPDILGLLRKQGYQGVA